jgi:hypothetical protein
MVPAPARRRAMPRAVRVTVWPPVRGRALLVSGVCTGRSARAGVAEVMLIRAVAELAPETGSRPLQEYAP